MNKGQPRMSLKAKNADHRKMVCVFALPKMNFLCFAQLTPFTFSITYKAGKNYWYFIAGYDNIFLSVDMAFLSRRPICILYLEVICFDLFYGDFAWPGAGNS